jgi:hypothetical protein
MRTSLAAAAISLAVLGCSADSDTASDGLSLAMEPLDLAPGEEWDGMCQSFTLDNDDWIYVNAVSLATDGGFHHSNWFHVPDNQYEGPDGLWPCEDRGFSEPIAAAVGGVLFAQSTQSTDETMQFPEGVVIPIPPKSKIVGGVHVLNATGEPLSTTLRMDVASLPEAEVDTMLSGLSLEIQSIALPARSRSSFGTACSLAAEHERQLERPMDFSIYYVLPHYHDLGRGLTVEATGGPGGDTVVFDNAAGVGDPLGKQIEPAFDMTGYGGLRFSCHYDNPRDEIVRWGIGDQEMCVFLAFTDSELLWGGGVLGGEPGELEMRNGVPHFERECFLLSYPSSHF